MENKDFDSLFEEVDEDLLFEDIEDDLDFSENMDEEEHYLDISDKILKLNDELSEEIVLKNIEEQMEGKISPLYNSI